MNWWKVIVGFTLLLGLFIALISVYRASVAGTMGKLGLVRSDFAATVNTDSLSDQYLAVASDLRCGIMNRFSGTIQFFLSSDDRQGELSFRLGRNRILCGASLLAASQAESGTYEVLKGIGYLKEGYRFVAERASVDYRVCRNLPETDVHTAMHDLLLATEGRVHELLSDEWGDVLLLQQQVDPVCLEGRDSVR